MDINQTRIFLQTAGVKKIDPTTLYTLLLEEAQEFAQATDTIDEFKEVCKEYSLVTVKADKSRSEALNAVVDMHVIVENFAHSEGFSVPEVQKEFANVTQDNLNKFATTENEAINTVNAYKNGNHPSGKQCDATYQKVGNYYVIYRNPDMKILKALSYFN